ncbi:MAG: hypothetical protein V2A73_17560 [Pseudomonadota bacterium]
MSLEPHSKPPRPMRQGKRAFVERARSVLRAALAGYLAAWFVSSPLVQVAHLVFADHNHHYCEKHHQVEDIPGKGPAADAHPADATAAGGEDGSRRLTIPTGSTHSAHVGCSILNSGTTRDPRLLHRSYPAPVGQPLFTGSLVLLWPDGFVSCPLLLTAPKTSPPFVLV